MKSVITVRNSSYGKVMFSQESVILSTGMGVRVSASGSGGVSASGLGVYIPLGRHPLGRHPLPQTATAADWNSYWNSFLLHVNFVETCIFNVKFILQFFKIL